MIRTRRTHAATSPVPSASTIHCATSEPYVRAWISSVAKIGPTVSTTPARATVVTTEPTPQSRPASSAGASRYGRPTGSIGVAYAMTAAAAADSK